MKCPHCRSDATEVFNSRSTKFGNQIWRRRRCTTCNHTFTTYEAPDLTYIKIAKRHSKKLESYSKAKLFSSIYGAFSDIKAKASTIDAVTDTVEAKLLDMEQAEISTEEIATIVLQTLKHFNTTAFVRYLSDQTDLVSEAQLRKELKRY